MRHLFRSLCCRRSNLWSVLKFESSRGRFKFPMIRESFVSLSHNDFGDHKTCSSIFNVVECSDFISFMMVSSVRVVFIDSFVFWMKFEEQKMENVSNEWMHQNKLNNDIIFEMKGDTAILDYGHCIHSIKYFSPYFFPLLVSKWEAIKIPCVDGEKKCVWI